MIGLSEILIFIAGIIYGYTKPAQEDTGKLLKTGFIYGLIIGAVIGILQSGILEALADIGTFLMLVFVAGVVFAVSAFIGNILKRYLRSRQ